MSSGRGLVFFKNGHLNVEGYTDADWASYITDRRSTFGYFTFVGGNLVTWRSKKQKVVARSSAEAEFRVQHDRTKHVEIDRHFIKEKLDAVIINFSFVGSQDQLTDVLTKGMVDLGLSKVPEQYIQPPHERIVKLNAPVHELPPIDLSKLDGPDHDQVANDIANAAEVLGFFQVLNHGMPLELLESLKSSANDFFGQEPEKKAAYRKGVSPSPYVKYGTSFVPEKEKALEWKDYLSMVYTTDADALNYWSNECKEVALEYLKTSIDMVKKILKVLITKLGLTVGVGRHSDMGTLTVLLQYGIGGLYVKLEEDLDAGKKGEWIEINPGPGALVINIGDTLQLLMAEEVLKRARGAAGQINPMRFRPNLVLSGGEPYEDGWGNLKIGYKYFSLGRGTGLIQLEVGMSHRSRPIWKPGRGISFVQVNT
ncbi:feruloyl CoA ortho-hydroxylase 1-like [Pyrus ussuriensis x Pyrus communis]|uniref:Feruloyl CoA ortho-hydroxylase 1-like n=1 Tax=Pyrus ussuriensis x Pyrus communis TaxID=2448454 RepID=A0A5N5FFN9_9ROSA|nr:feruloyl CoA ortho-hydroxylase 1-like [Pyrus ussuriensis x Pyrus communis]